MKSQSVVTEIRRKIFAEVARVAYKSKDIKSDIEAIPYTITPDEEPKYRESIYRERQIAAERVRLAMGLSLRPANKPVHITSGVTKSNVSDKYYEPPLMQVIPSACDKCPENEYEVTNQCRNCVAHYCIKACPKGAISVVNGKSFIDKEKCIKCGKCKAACPYDAIAHKVRPCASACGIKAISTDEFGRASIDNDKCVACGQCMSACPFGAIADKSQIFQLIQAIKKGDKVIAAVAPAIAGQFGVKVNLGKIKTALLKLGFADMYEVAEGADMGCIAEAHHYVNTVKTGKMPFLLTSCCPAWASLIKSQFPTIASEVSSELTPMVATARKIKEEVPEARVVFIGPCAAKKLEASRKAVRSHVDFVITFEELAGIFDAKEIDLEGLEESVVNTNASGAGRGYAVAGGVAEAIRCAINEFYPETTVTIHHAEGLSDCKMMLNLAKAGKLNGSMIEGMGCLGGCVAGVGTIIPPEKAKILVGQVVKNSEPKLPSNDLLEVAERLTKMD
ncbi:MAG: 4Fe-4S dicluster domain-containing protein [Clostridiales bacterium]|nr:4Fe-4S dicluster domain-containing protein [Clostridiales bacterium]